MKNSITMNRILTCRRISSNLSSAVMLKTFQNVKICGYATIPVESQKDLKINSDVGIGSTNQTTSIKNLTIEPIPLIQRHNSSLFDESMEISPELLHVDSKLEKTPLPFEEVPSPALLQFLEKYWKYVPLLGQLTWGQNMKFLLPMKYLFNEYGPIVRIHGILMNDVVLIHRPEHIAEVLKQENEYPIRSGLDTLHHYRVNLRKYKLSGLYSIQGEEWKDLRTKVDKPFNEEIYKFIGKIGIACDELAQRICSIRNRQDEVPNNFSNDLTRWGMECFAVLMFNKKLGFLEPSGYNISSEQVKFTEALLQAHKYMSVCESGFQIWRFIDTPFSKKLYSACDIIDGFISKHIRQAEHKLRNNAAENKFDKDFSIIEQFLFKQQLQPEDISTILMDAILLGVLATVNTQAFLLYLIAKNPRIQSKLYEEITTNIPDERAISKEKLKNMIYLNACLKESLRLYPAFPYITRLLQKQIVLHGYTIPKETYIVMANEISSQREENFEDPEKFKPERWLNSNEQFTVKQEFSCLPFGHGIRSCIGKSMAEMQIMLLTSTLLRKFKLEYDYANIHSKYFLVNVPNKPLRFRFINREPSIDNY